MRTSETALNQDFKNYFKIHKRNIFNRLLDKSGKNPFPQGKHPAYRYNQLLEDIFYIYKKPLYMKLFLRDNLITQQTTIKQLLNKEVIKVHPGITFNEFMETVITKDKRCQTHYFRLSECYKVAYECMEFADTSGHLELTVKCNPSHMYYMRKVFRRFNLNQRCLELDHKSKTPYMVINMEGDKR